MQWAQRVNTVRVIGTGVMGRGIAQLAATAGLTVELADARPEAAEDAARRLKRTARSPRLSARTARSPRLSARTVRSPQTTIGATLFGVTSAAKLSASSGRGGAWMSSSRRARRDEFRAGPAVSFVGRPKGCGQSGLLAARRVRMASASAAESALPSGARTRLRRISAHAARERSAMSRPCSVSTA
ncbi:3-hydroxyacyl-CoA dehydrogenase NAD-binding domain-containing protein [Saccharopolyspora pogona]|uniref:3-hydroxyacyl-CoA dehydrogenase NAD-binding domain-containing protein n=1 Tax=Saccharopolyspora pogona TaxID=333966 RepID=UPI00295B86C6|nr:3-hydroxyacyl-CoA dehydrogenase NAD-binding domain-containing protein [Saccharopolyspora pogona]